MNRIMDSEDIKDVIKALQAALDVIHGPHECSQDECQETLCDRLHCAKRVMENAL